jgi:hypothetical protein
MEGAFSMGKWMFVQGRDRPDGLGGVEPCFSVIAFHPTKPLWHVWNIPTVLAASVVEALQESTAAEVTEAGPVMGKTP